MSSNIVTAKEEMEKPPAFSDGFADYGIALHFVLARPKDVSRFAKLEPSDDHFRSFERDLLSHVYRDDTGFECRVLELPAGFDKPVTLHLPRALKYVAESEHRDLIQLDATLDHGTGFRTRSLLMRASLTRFRSGISILHIVFNPATQEDGSTDDKWSLSEYDFMKLAKLWEGGESVGKSEPNDIHEKLKFSLPSASEVTLLELVGAVISNNNTVNANRQQNLIEISDEDLGKLRPRAGTIEIVVGDRKHRDLFDVLVKLASKDPTQIGQAHRKVAGNKKLENQLVYVQGILCGLLDFNIDADEFNDVFDAPIAVDLTQLLDMHKGTLLKFITRDRAFESAYSTIGISPYLLLPQAILLHNEELLRNAVLEARGTDGVRFEVELRKAELALRNVLQRELLPNVFQYPTEIDLHHDGHKSRGLTNLQNSLEQRLKEIDGRLDEVVSKKEALLATCLAVFGVVLALGQMVSGWDQVASLHSRWFGVSLGQSQFLVAFIVVPVVIITVPVAVIWVFWTNRHRRG